MIYVVQIDTLVQRKELFCQYASCGLFHKLEVIYLFPSDETNGATDCIIKLPFQVWKQYLSQSEIVD